MQIFLNSYYPIMHTAFGRSASFKHKIHPLEDGSIRREPDFSHPLPRVSGLCRPGTMKDIELGLGDILIYKTNRTHFLTAILEVFIEFDSHDKAHNWLQKANYCIPTNNILTDPLPLEKSHALDYIDRIGKSNKLDKAIHEKWNEDYLLRGKNKKSSYFFLTKPIYNAVHLNLNETDFVHIDKLLRSHYSSIPNTSWRPQELTESFYLDLIQNLKSLEAASLVIKKKP